MNPRVLRPRRIVILVGLAIVLFSQATSALVLRYLRCQNKASEFTSAEDYYRTRADSLEEVATNLREVATLAREMAKSSSSDFERNKWLSMAKTEEQKADKSDADAVRMMSTADQYSNQANEFSKLAWLPWLPAPE